MEEKGGRNEGEEEEDVSREETRVPTADRLGDSSREDEQGSCPSAATKHGGQRPAETPANI